MIKGEYENNRKSFCKKQYILFFLFLCFPNISSSAEPFGTELGSYNGIISYSNGSSNYNSGSYNYIYGVNTGLKWQCVEYVNRYYYQIYGIDLRSLHQNHAKTYYDNAERMGLDRYPNGGSIAPQKGDIIVSEDRDHGHVAIVRSVSDNQVCTIQQNFTNLSIDTNLCRTLTVSGGDYTLASFNLDGSYPVRGWLRNPGNPSTGRVDVSDGVDISPSTVTVGQNYEVSFDLSEFQNGYKYLYGVEVWLQDADGNDIRRIKKWFDSDDTNFSPNETKSYTVSDDSDAPVSAEGWYKIAVKGRLGEEGEDRFTFGIVNGSGAVNPKNFYVEAASVSYPPEGYHDSVDCSTAQGWARDPDTIDPIYIHFYLDGPAGTGTYIGSTLADTYRSDLPYVDKNHGFSFALPDSLYDGLEHQIYAYAIDSGGGTNPLLTNSPKTIRCILTNNQLSAVLFIIENIILSEDTVPSTSRTIPVIIRTLLLSK